MLLLSLTKTTRWFRAVVSLQLGLIGSSLFAATSVSQSGITWKFDRDYPVGQFANGDFWVQGPVKVVGITPGDSNLSDSTDIHGAMVNPMPDTSGPYVQSWDSRVGGGTTYDRAQNVARKLPLSLPAGSSLVSVNSYASPNGDGLHLQDAAVLTVVSKAPAAGSFRPPYAGTDKTIPGNVADLNLTIFRSLAPVAGAPALSVFAGAFNQPQLDIIGQWPNSSVKNAHAGPHYGRDIARQVGDAVLALNLNYSAAEKKALLIRLVQRGIDTYGLAKAGMVWWPNGGHNTGRKLPLLIAGKALGNADMLAWADAKKHFIFHEDMQHFYIEQSDVTLPRLTSDSQPYNKSMIGQPEWASNPLTERQKTGSEWPKPYRINNGSVNTGQVLAAQIMGLRDEWNWEPLFDYIDKRYWPMEGPVATTKVPIPTFHRAMWAAYRNSQPSKIEVDNTSTSGLWQNAAIDRQTGSFTCTFDMIPSATKIDALAGLSKGQAGDFTDLATAIRFAPSGFIDARNGNTYQAVTAVPYSAGVKYSVTLTVNTSARTYSATVKPAGGSTVTVAQNYRFRTEQSSTGELSNVGFVACKGAHSVLDIAVTGQSGSTQPSVPSVPSTPSIPPAPTVPENPPAPEQPSSPSVGTTVLRYNAGASYYTDKKGNVWSPDAGYISGSLTRSTKAAIAGTEDDALFQSHRYDNPRSGALLVYRMPVANGSYKVRLMFSEIEFDSAKARVFDVKVEGQLAIQKLDVFTKAGGMNKPVTIDVNTTVKDGQLELWFDRSVGDPFVSAIEVIKL